MKRHIFAFTAGKGGCGKTTISCNFANVLHGLGNRVLIVDCDLHNQGATGVFFESIDGHIGKPPHDALSLLTKDDPGDRAVVQVKPGLFFIPAAETTELANEPLEGKSVVDAAARFRENLEKIAEEQDIQCIVLDCFCGLDELTTGTIGASDFAFLVNEPDPVTFTGTLLLLRHLKKEFEAWESSPSLQFVVNRMRTPDTVASLMRRYRDNLGKEAAGGIAIHLPYNERILRSFGRYPFVSDLVPGSLFVEKLKLLAYAVLYDVAPQRLGSVAKWSAWRRSRVYLKSVDPAAVDAERLVLQLTRFAALGVFFFFTFVFLSGFLTNPQSLDFAISIVTVLALLCSIPLIRAIWSAGRLNLTIAMFQIRAARVSRVATEKLRLRMGSAGYCLTSLGLFLFLIGIAGIMTAGISELSRIRSQVKESDNATAGNTLSAARVEYSLLSTAAVVDLSHKKVDGAYELEWQRPMRSEWSEKKGGRTAYVLGSTFKNVIFSPADLSNTKLVDVDFEECVFRDKRGAGQAPESSSAASPSEQETALTIENASFVEVDIIRPQVIKGSHYSKLKFVGRDAALDESSFTLDAGTVLDLRSLPATSIRKVTVINADRTSEDDEDAFDKFVQDVTVIVPSGASGAIKARPGVAVVEPEGREKKLADAIETRRKILASLDADDWVQSSFIERANLVELYLLRNTEEDLRNARRILDALDEKVDGRLQQGQAAARAYQMMDGLRYMLRAVLEVRKGNQSDAPAQRWMNWLENNPRSKDEASHLRGEKLPLSAWSWSWELWDEYVFRERNAVPLRACLELFRRSSDGEITSGMLRDGYSELCAPPLALRGKLSSVERPDKNGDKKLSHYVFELWLELSDTAKERIKSVDYAFPKALEVKPGSSSERASGFLHQAKYVYICTGEVEVTVHFVSGQRVSRRLDLCETVGWEKRPR